MFSNLIRKISHPNEKGNHTLDHPAIHGASLEEHNPPSTALRRLVSIETTKQIVSQGNIGSTGMEALRIKAVDQKQKVAERSRLQAAGLFEPHLPHAKLVNLTPEHRSVADGRDLFVSPTTEHKV